MNKKIPCGLVFAFALYLLCEQAAASPRQCAEMLNLLLPDVRVTEAVAIADSGLSTGPVNVPHCKVSGVIGQEIRFEMLLPDDWNQRFFMGGGGGYVGQVVNAALGTVNQGYATVGTDTGHEGNGIQAGWALNHLERQLNFGYLAIHRTAEVAKALIRAYYGSAPEFSYFTGCSRGGGQALMEAQRYPEDFDGIIAGAPAFDWTGFMAEMIQNVQLSFPDPKHLAPPVVTLDNLKLLESKVLAACDHLDGVTDGIMEDPRDCSFDWAGIPACPEDLPGPDCFTQAQRAAIARVYAPTANQDGVIYPGQPFGGESHPQGWHPWITGTAGRAFEDLGIPSLQWGFGTEFFKYFVFGDPKWDYTRYDFSTWKEDTRLVSTFIDATDPDLSAFKNRGGKLILWHGWSDPALSALGSVEYYEQVEALDVHVREYFRLFLLPGVLHCGGGPGPDNTDWNAALMDWVEKGVAPERLVAAKHDEGGQVVRTRPLCPYPQRAVYTGKGSSDAAESFVCQSF